MFEVFVIAICLFANAILSCIEMAFVTVSKPHLKQLSAKGNLAAARVIKLKETPERTLSILQIGITLVGAISAAVGGAGAEETLSPIFQNSFALSEETAEILSIIAIVIPLTYLSVVIGELVPKSLALRFPMKLALGGGLILQVLDKVFAPFVYILEESTRLLLKLISHNLPAESIHEMNTTVDLEPLTDSSKQYVLNLMNVDKKTVQDILLPWDQVCKVEITLHYTEVLQIIKDSRHTRLPVVHEEMVVGILHSKEFVSETEITRLNWAELIRPVMFLKPNEPIINALKLLQGNKSHLGVIKDGAQVLGMVTMEDIFEEVVGDIYDEDDSPRALLSTNSKIRNMGLTERKR